ncbi:unknown [Acetobacter sp. CAG:267]|nr:unknown [Acetobacter sp. CAG:267]
MLNFLLTKEKAFDFLSKIFSIITPRPIEMFSVEMFSIEMFPVEMFPKSCMCKKSRGAD